MYEALKTDADCRLTQPVAKKQAPGGTTSTPSSGRPAMGAITLTSKVVWMPTMDIVAAALLAISTLESIF